MKRVEATVAILLAAAILLVGGAALYFAATMLVHRDAASVPSSAAPLPAGRYSGAVEEARRLARSLVVDENLPGLSVAVAQDGRIVWAEGFGWADLEDRVPVTPLTRFRVGAAAMPMTAAAIGLLHERGRIDLDAPVQRYVPAYPEKEWPISTRQLMGHVSGVQREAMPGRHCASLDEAVEIFRAEPLRFRPGTEYRYSVYGWILVSKIVEAVAGEPFLAFMNREVFAPAGMERTVPDDTRGVADRAWFYFPRTGLDTKLGMQDAPEADYSCYGGAGTYVSTPSDLVCFGSAMLKPGLLKAGTLAMLHTPQRLESGASTQSGLGWQLQTVQIGGATARVLGHRGSSSGGTTSFLTFPDFNLVVAATANVSHAKGVEQFGVKVAEAFATATRSQR
jgi:CubicO group peptidase (beta-lactamase class C family)